jgi:hypothetical protein
MEDGQWTRTGAGTPQGGVISPLLSNIYLHVLDRVWEDRCARLGTLVRYADDFVILCDTKAHVEEARQRVDTVLARLGLELHPEKTRLVDLSRGRAGFDFLGCHLRKRLSGPIWERTHRRVFYLQRQPSQRAVPRRSPRRYRGTEWRPPWVGAVLSHRERGGEIRPDRYVRRGTLARSAPEAGGLASSSRPCRRLAPSLLRSLGALPPARLDSISGGGACHDLKTTW